MSHTPGPWRYGIASNYSGFYVAPENCMPTLAAVERPAGSDSTTNVMVHNFPGETEANARLIAAAPEMLAILKRIVAVDDRGDTPSPSLMEEALAVVKKAEQ